MKSKGFTLIEIMIVLAILGLLGVVAFPFFSVAREKAQEAIIQRDLKALSEIIDMFQLDYDRYPKSWEELRHQVRDIDRLKEKYELNTSL